MTAFNWATTQTSTRYGKSTTVSPIKSRSVACRLALRPDRRQDQLGTQHECREADRQNGDDTAGQPPPGLFAPLGPFLQKGGEEGGRQRAFAEHAAGQIGDAERDGKGVHQRPVAEDGRHADVA